MGYAEVVVKILQDEGVELSTMMKSPCLRYKGEFIAMMFEKEDALIIKVSPDRVNQLIDEGDGLAFNFTKKQFKEWVLIPTTFEDQYNLIFTKRWNTQRINEHLIFVRNVWL